jgi:hypothetical protein
VLDERCEVVPVAVSVWFPLRSLELNAIGVHQVPLLLAVTEGYRVRSRVMVTFSPGRKPAPQNVMVDPAVGCELLTEVVAWWLYGEAVAGAANPATAMITPNRTMSDARRRLMADMRSP